MKRIPVPMKRFALMGDAQYYPSGGTSSTFATFDTLEECKQGVLDYEEKDYWGGHDFYEALDFDERKSYYFDKKTQERKGGVILYERK